MGTEHSDESIAGVLAAGSIAGKPRDPEVDLPLRPETVVPPVSSADGGSPPSSAELPIGTVLGVAHPLCKRPLGVVSEVFAVSLSSWVGDSVHGSDILYLSFPLNPPVLPRVSDTLLDSSVEKVFLPLPNPLLTLGQGEDAGLVPAANSICLEIDVFSEEPMPLASCPTTKARGSSAARKRSRASILRLVKNFGHFVGLSCDGYEGKLAALLEDILASNEKKAAVGKKGMRELNSLFSSINYDVHSGSASLGRSKGRDQRGVL
jgi:hypothetical protein